VRWALEQATQQPLRISLELVRLGAFNDRRGPRVIWVGLDGTTVDDREALYRLAEGLETWLESAGFPREGRFAPHLTLARVPDEVAKEQRGLLLDVSSSVELPPTPALQVERVSLMRSHLGPGGTRYERIASFPASHPSFTGSPESQSGRHGNGID
jgi:2'-5' RNA ligase